MNDPFFSLLEIIVIAALVARRIAACYFYGDGRQRTQQISVVRDQQHGAFIGAQKLLQPFDRRKVKKVGGFIEHQQIRIRDERACQLRAHLPAPGK